MKWMLVERKPDVVYAGGKDLYLAKDGGETHDQGCARTFDTREAAEAHRRHLPHPYGWVAVTAEN
jgi:hypothetical protein